MPTSPWSNEAETSHGSALTECVRAAVAAPSVHNTQPWLFQLRGNSVDVFVDRRRQLRVADPDGREMHVSVGAALFNLRVAMLARGRQPLVQVLPDPERPDLAATVTVGPAVAAPADILALAEAIPHRHTSRRPFGSTSVPQAVLAALTSAAEAEGGTLSVVDPISRTAILDIVRSAEARQRSDARYRAELAEWTTPDRERADGVPPYAFGPRPELAALPVRDFDPARSIARPVARFERDPTIAVLSTAGDAPADWLQAGQALEGVLLTATVHGLVAVPLTQAMELDALRQLVSALQHPRVAQLVLRLGYAARGRPTPRRDEGDVLIQPEN